MTASVDPGKLGLAGHGMGGECAVFVAAGEQRTRTVSTLAETHPSGKDAANRCDVPVEVTVGHRSACRVGIATTESRLVQAGG